MENRAMENRARNIGKDETDKQKLEHRKQRNR